MAGFNGGNTFEMDGQNMREEIEGLYVSADAEQTSEVMALLQRFRKLLNNGEIRVPDMVEGRWHVNKWVKMGILLHAVCAAHGCFTFSRRK